jgi:hypothetical protein
MCAYDLHHHAAAAPRVSGAAAPRSSIDVGLLVEPVIAGEGLQSHLKIRRQRGFSS